MSGMGSNQAMVPVDPVAFALTKFAANMRFHGKGYFALAIDSDTGMSWCATNFEPTEYHHVVEALDGLAEQEQVGAGEVGS